MNLWNKTMNTIGDALWFVFFLLIGAGLMALFFVTYFIPKRDSLRELVRTQQAELLKARIAFEKARRDRLIADRTDNVTPDDGKTGAAGANSIVNGDK